MDISDQIQNMSKAFDAYIGNQQDVQKEQQMLPMKSQLLQQKSSLDTKETIDVAKAKQGMEGTLSPEMGQQLFSQVSPEFGQAAAQALTTFKQTNGRDMTTDEAAKTLEPIMKALETKKAKSNIKHYMGNDPDGNAIFSDNEGNMFGPDLKPYEGKVLPKSSNQPTSSTRSSAEFADTILPHITDMRDLIQQAESKGYLGPAAGRVYGQFLAGKVGSTGDDDADRLLGKLRSTDSLLKTGAMRVHFGARGGQQMYEHFSEILNSGKQSAKMLNGELDTLESFMQGYSDAGKPAGAKSTDKKSKNDPLGLGI